MIVRLVRTAAVMAVLGMCTSSLWAQVSRPQPGSNQPRGVRPTPAPANGAKNEFRFSEDEEPRPRSNPVYRGPVENRGPAENRGTVENRGPVRPVGGQIDEPRRIDPNAIIPCPWQRPTAEEQQLLDKVLATWEARSGKVTRYRCNFERWEYDPILGPKKTGRDGNQVADPEQYRSYSEGKLRYGAPDKGMFKVEAMQVAAPPTKEGGKYEYLKRAPDEINEHWVCDGKNIFTFDVASKKLFQQELPPEMQGKAIVDGPLPFLFGAKAEKIKARYWVRLITPPDEKGSYWLEAAPKYAADAKNFKMVHLIIDGNDFLPTAMQLFDPGFDPQKNWKRTVLTFKDREANFNVLLEKIKIWEAEFSAPRTPFGWTKVVEPFLGEPGQPPAGKVPTAQRPNPLKVPIKPR